MGEISCPHLPSDLPLAPIGQAHPEGRGQAIKSTGTERGENSRYTEQPAHSPTTSFSYNPVSCFDTVGHCLPEMITSFRSLCDTTFCCSSSSFRKLLLSLLCQALFLCLFLKHGCFLCTPRAIPINGKLTSLRFLPQAPDFRLDD